MRWLGEGTSLFLCWLRVLITYPSVFMSILLLRCGCGLQHEWRLVL